VFAELPGLQVIVTGHAIGGLAMASGLSDESQSPTGAIDVLRKHVFIDTQLIHPALIRASVDLLGAERVVVGSDWPIVDKGPIREPLADAMRRAALSDAEQEAVRAGNCARLLTVH
jgi:hypothetical protein